MAPRTLQEILASMTGTISSNFPGNASNPPVSTKSGTVISDAVLAAPANEFVNVYISIDDVSKLLTLQNYDSFTVAELDSMASDYGLTRLQGNKSRGVIVFRYSTIVDVVIPYGTSVSTGANSNTPNVNFITSQSIYISSANMAAYSVYNSASNNYYYEVAVPIESSNIGISNNVASGTIVNLQSTVSNVVSIYNYLATNGGTDQESNQSLASRIQAKIIGNNIGTKSGYVGTVSADTRVIGSLVVGPNDFEMLRNQYGGSIDIYILGTDYAEITDAPYTYNSGVTSIVLNNPPVKSIVSVVSGNGTTLDPTTNPPDYTLQQDVGFYANSAEAQDKLVLTATGIAKLSNTDTLTITYTYDKLIKDLQIIVNQDSGKILEADVLVREANPITVNVVANVNTYSGYTQVTVQANIETALSNYFAGLGLNQNVVPSKLVEIIELVDGVSKVDLGTFVPQNPIVINKNQYAIVGSLTINMV